MSKSGKFAALFFCVPQPPKFFAFLSDNLYIYKRKKRHGVYTIVTIHKKMREQYQIEKWIWNQNDFEQMGWHDNAIWAMAFDDNVKFDLDYIFNWVKPESKYGSYRFWISPVTLIFSNPTKFKVEMETDFVNGLEIADIEREIIDDKTTYIIQAQEGRILIETEI